MSSTSVVRVALMSAASAAALIACSLTRPLDYLTAGAGEVDAGDGGVADAAEGGVPAETIAAGQLAPRNLTQDDGNLYWSNADGAIMKTAKAGGTAEKISSAPPGMPVLWMSADPGAGGDLWVIAGPAVHRVSKGGGDLQQVENESPKPHALAVDEDYLFVIHYDDNAPDFGHLVRFSKRDLANRAVLSVEDDDPATLTLHGGSVFWAGYTLDGAGVIFELPRDAPPDAGATAKIHRGPGAEHEVYPDRASGFAADDEAIYFIEGEAIYRLSRLQMTAPSTVYFPPREAKPSAFAFDGANLYVLDERDDGSIVRVPKTGGAVTPVTSSLRIPTAVVVDSAFVYFTVQGSGIQADGAVLRAPK